ncbi:urea ABC transporter ATP-binding protein UrtD [Paraburkholderia sp. SARCC-3016]|uniref:urea ABC transporter ATP-binding protein UrtD n=1 Tax=Paraburkholderia sp. SARCC-3016 TaxID=3058611 RepID=UPI0028085F02|nr:urea ABC transporter ATP-binding protein UrtD [Paraburkholderia sp. SARCC-3016]MDQ7980790.1 urea ABC transporter ATP-binding protein UrtD [Paraburkholderia sp. SARCC-3016]
MNPTPQTAIYISGLSVTFSGFAAITNLSMEFRYGEIRAIIGPNGAGKTTLMDVITGKTRPAAGEVFLNKVTNLAALDETAIARLGIGRKFQKPSVFEALRVRENLELAIRNGRGYADMVRSRLTQRQHARIDEVLDTISLAAEGERMAGTLSHGQKQWLEIGMLLVADPHVILLDEPVAGMTDHETSRTAELIARLKAPERAVIVIEHDMDFVGEIADLVSVLHEGKLLGEGSMASVRANPEVIRVYLGR